MKVGNRTFLPSTDNNTLLLSPFKNKYTFDLNSGGSKFQNPPFFTIFLAKSSLKFVYRPVFDVIVHSNKKTGP